jgi:hypothetical protein
VDIDEILLKMNGTAFYKNCKSQRKKNAKICQDCPFREAIEEFEKQPPKKLPYYPRKKVKKKKRLGFTDKMDIYKKFRNGE